MTQAQHSVSDSNPEGRDLGLGAKPASAIREAETPNPLPADHAEVVNRLQKYRGWPDTPEQQALVTDALALITSQAEEIERLRREHFLGTAFDRIAELESDIERITKERDGARIWHEKAHTFLEERNAYKRRADAAESSLASMTARCKELETALEPFAKAGQCDACAPNTNPLREDRMLNTALWTYYDSRTGQEYQITPTHCRNAARALSQSKGTDD